MKNNHRLLLFFLIIVLISSVIISSLIGSVKMPIIDSVKILLNHLPFMSFEPTWTTGQETIIWDLRMPRIFLALIIGAMLSVSGVAFQGVLRNPLADPYILGVSSGATLGAATYILFFEQSSILGQFALSLFAFIGGLLSLGLVFIIANVKVNQTSETLILAGVIVQSFAGAILTFLIAISGEQMQEIIFWMMGSLSHADWIDIVILLPYLIFGSIFIFSQYRELNIMSLGEKAATYLGMDVLKKKIVILLVASLLAASAVSVVGIIGFVGLIIPHLVRIIVGPNHRVLLPISFLVGAIFLLWSDNLARTIIESREIPIGVITAFIGAPFFAYLLRGKLRRES